MALHASSVVEYKVAYVGFSSRFFIQAGSDQAQTFLASATVLQCVPSVHVPSMVYMRFRIHISNCTVAEQQVILWGTVGNKEAQFISQNKRGICTRIILSAILCVLIYTTCILW